MLFSDDERFELAVINPAYVLGPILGVGEGTSSLVSSHLALDQR